MSVKLSRQAYAKKYGPTIGDRVRLADSELIIEIERALRATTARSRSSAAASRSATVRTSARSRSR